MHAIQKIKKRACLGPTRVEGVQLGGGGGWGGGGSGDIRLLNRKEASTKEKEHCNVVVEGSFIVRFPFTSYHQMHMFLTC